MHRFLLLSHPVSCEHRLRRQAVWKSPVFCLLASVENRITAGKPAIKMLRALLLGLSFLSFFSCRPFAQSAVSTSQLQIANKFLRLAGINSPDDISAAHMEEVTRVLSTWIRNGSEPQ
jgi:hypothetical protein